MENEAQTASQTARRKRLVMPDKGLLVFGFYWFAFTFHSAEEKKKKAMRALGLSLDFRDAMNRFPETDQLARRFDAKTPWLFGLNVLAGVFTGVSVVCFMNIYVYSRDIAILNFAPEVVTGIFMMSLALLGISYLVTRDLHRDLLRMVERYNALCGEEGGRIIERRNDLRASVDCGAFKG